MLQNYLREQPDNIKSVNLVAETTKFLQIVYSNINDKSLPLVVQLFDTLVEFTSVSERYVLLNFKGISYCSRDHKENLAQVSVQKNIYKEWSVSHILYLEVIKINGSK